MKSSFAVILVLAVGAVVVIGTRGAQNSADTGETKVELKRVHMCCDGCSDEVARVLNKVAGVKNVAVDQEAKTARFAAKDLKTAQGAIDALAAAGFHGDSGSQKFMFQDDSGVKAGTVKTLTLTGFHNTCGGCVRSFREAIKDVPGVTGDNLKAKVSACEIKGNFDAVKLVQALNQAGLHVKVKNESR
jgi:mercuric ion binding protein